MLWVDIEYLRSILYNYRTLKKQLREAELLNLNYLDYLVKEWHGMAQSERLLKLNKISTHQMCILEDQNPKLLKYFNSPEFGGIKELSGIHKHI